MNIVTFSSATGNNMTVVDHVLKQHGHRGVSLNFSDDPACGAVERARRLRIPTLVHEPLLDSGMSRNERRAAQRVHHDALATTLAAWERWNGHIDLIVLAYHRFIEGELLTRYAGRIVNQHPGDLSVKDPSGRRELVGMRAVEKAYKSGLDHTRSSTILVNELLDGGPVIARGPKVHFEGIDDNNLRESLVAHEHRQKTISDTPCLAWVVAGFLAGNIKVCPAAMWPYLDGVPIGEDGYCVTGGGW